MKLGAKITIVVASVVAGTMIRMAMEENERGRQILDGLKEMRERRKERER